MGRALVILVVLCTAYACGRPAGPPPPRGATAHADLTCAACHGSGLQPTRATARVQDATCMRSGCHADGGPADATLRKVAFRHHEHGPRSQIKATCAGCHPHVGDVKDKSLRATGDACTLCHADQLAGRRSADCRTCHKDPAEVPLTSQGVPIPHSSLQAAQTSCLRCHYDVAAPATGVPVKKCASCHQPGTVTAGLGKDLHPAHAGVGCAGCHEGASHRVVAISSAVRLDCRDCHTESHQVGLGALGNPSETCNGCHGQAHQAQQRLLIGQVAGVPVEPSMKFAAGMTCRSCHSAAGVAPRAAGTSLRGQSTACVGCHRPEYGRVLRWWIDGSRSRATAVSAYLEQAAASAGAVPAGTRASLDTARMALAVVSRAGGEHNIEMTDAIFRDVIGRARAAYRAAGRPAPAAPALGNAPRVGFCSYCHYSTGDAWDFKSMPADFHRAVLDTLRMTAAIQAPR